MEKISFERFEEKESKEQVYDTILEYGKSLEKPDPKTFVDVYSPKEIGEDLNRLRLTKKRIAEDNLKKSGIERETFEDNMKRGESLEIILTDQIYDGNWMGEEAMTVPTCEYDDIVNGVDLVVEFDKEKPERIALAVDASTASDIRVMEKKINRNIQKLKNSSALQEVKYFESQISDSDGNYYKGGLKELIPVVVGADKYNIDSLFEIFSELKTLEKGKREDTKERRKYLREELSRHSVQEIFLQEIKIQLEMYKKCLGEESVKIDEYTTSLINIIDEVIDKKREENVYNEEDVPRDNAFMNIKEVCESFLETNGIN